MLTKLTVRNFKPFEELEVDLGNPVVFIGPNNSGKTSAMQALALWEAGLHRWNERRAGPGTPERRPGVAINRRDLTAVPVPDARALWHQLRVRRSWMEGDRQANENVRIEVEVEGETDGRMWRCGLEFDYANEESLYCRPLRLRSESNGARMPVPGEAADTRIAFLPPMSGLAEVEDLLQPGTISVRIGQGRTAEVLRNICYEVYEQRPDAWAALVDQVVHLFGARLNAPEYVAGRGQVIMTYEERGVSLDLTASGRGLQQTLLLLAYIYSKPGAVLLLDEPDAHLEVLRQAQVYDLITEVAGENGNQVIAASHSEVLLNAAAEKDEVIAFVGRPHRIDQHTAEVAKSLAEIGWDQYYRAEQTGWVLYLEGDTDLSILRSFARRRNHERAQRALERPFVRMVGNVTDQVRRHFYGLREALPDLRGVALFDQREGGRPDLGVIECLLWERREVENYICTPRTLEAFAAATAWEAADPPGPLFGQDEARRRVSVMREVLDELNAASMQLRQEPLWSPQIKASGEALEPIFRAYFERLGLYNPMAKRNFHQLVQYVPEDEIDPEVVEKLDAIAAVAESVDPPGLP